MNENEHMINIDSFMDLPDDMPDSIIEAGIRCRMGLARIYGGLELLKNGEKMAKDAGRTAHTARCHREVGRINLLDCLKNGILRGYTKNLEALPGTHSESKSFLVVRLTVLRQPAGR